MSLRTKNERLQKVSLYMYILISSVCVVSGEYCATRTSDANSSKQSVAIASNTF